ncbi:hypothetical protein LOK49_LG11G01262 [Camellia lanceoleosa]|uniref:Uncharacterized protein n=1 Tax=Camellia lanceoleosa TaxID=1840588 RepID=A0ACC0G1N4_9ERIC|nr:hypothetical protein LOK49_LG11G01262 [Camellia lanceoleosa]
MGGGSSDLGTETSGSKADSGSSPFTGEQVKYVERERDKNYRENERKGMTEKDKAEKHGAEKHTRGKHTI